MHNLVHPSRSLCVVVDVTGYSSRRGPEQQFAQHALVAVLTEAYARAGIEHAGLPVQPRGDGEIAVLPAGVNEPAVLAEFTTALEGALCKTNRHLNQRSRLRLRVAVHQGLVWPGETGFVGDAVIAACRLVDATEFRLVMAAHPHSDLALIVSSDIYHDVIRHEFTNGLRPDTFTPISVTTKAFRHRAWLYVARATRISLPARRRPILATHRTPGQAGHIRRLAQ